MTHIIVGCARSKLDRPAPALFLYTSTYLKVCREWACSVRPMSQIWVLSAKYGLVPSTLVIAPYSATFRTTTTGFAAPTEPLEPPISPADTARQIRAARLSGEVILLAGADYYRHIYDTDTGLDPWNPFTQNVPDKRYGYQMQAMKRSTGIIPRRQG